MRRNVRAAFNRLRGYARQAGVKLPVDRTIMSLNMELALAGKYEAAEARAARQLIQAGDTVLELGAGLGFLSACLRRETEAGRIVAYEANPELVSYIARQHKSNAVADIEIRHGAVLAQAQIESVPFYVRRDLWASSLSPDGEAKYGPVISTVKIPAVSWTGILAEIEPTLLIMDIEGGERDFFAACDLGSVQRIVVELHPALYGVAGLAQIYSALNAQNFMLKSMHANVLALERG